MREGIFLWLKRYIKRPPTQGVRLWTSMYYRVDLWWQKKVWIFVDDLLQIHWGWRQFSCHAALWGRNSAELSSLRLEKWKETNTCITTSHWTIILFILLGFTIQFTQPCNKKIWTIQIRLVCQILLCQLIFKSIWFWWSSIFLLLFVLVCSFWLFCGGDGGWVFRTMS